MNTNKLKLNNKLEYKLEYKSEKDLYIDNNKLSNGSIVVSQVKIDTNGNLLLLGYSNYAVKVSLSCLISPIDGDRVSAIIDGNNLYITSIIARENKKDLTINAEDYNLNILANNINFNVKSKICINSDKFTLFANKTQWQSDTSSYNYNRVNINCFTYFSNIESTSEVYAKNIIFKADQSYTLRSKIGVLTSDAMLKLDGGQIHMG